MRLWLYLHFPALQLNTLLTELKEQPIAIVQGQKNQLVQLNQAAQNAGLKKGMGLGSAAALCRELKVYPYDDEKQKKELIQIAQWLYWVTADISLSPPNGLLLKVSAMLELYKSPEHYWQVIHKHLNKIIKNYQYATADSPYGAKLLAQHNFNKILTDKFKITQQLNQYFLKQTELSSKTIESLNRVGILRVRDLLNMPLAELAKRFDAELLTYIGRLTGQLTTPVDFYHPPETFQYHLSLLFELSHLSYLFKPLLKIYQLLEQFLKIRGKQTHQIEIELILRDADNMQIHVGSAQGEYKADKWLELSQLTFESLKLASPVIEISVKADQLSDLIATEHDMFAAHQPECTAEELVERLQAKLGKTQVRGVKLINDHRPEKASQWCFPLTQTDNDITQLPKIRPSFILPVPQVLTEQVTVLHGPERINAGWWDNQAICRDYYIARSVQGRWLWIFKTRQQKWFVHGLFC
ncbi:Y-family DNA polymerase [Catenovulum adriaticum]|uniref:DNA polymerase Y family protein n=1 Tax=Catenovulum adriaticum TaxID=2984846 RepID=A0ABY7AMJ2_9ALTE|nr:DNA polymerase Y family protein [Catenovulum sp. TS8]WAJ69886.1 DNA polymerase Y family protein [Catenovulum sp. TS8]